MAEAWHSKFEGSYLDTMIYGLRSVPSLIVDHLHATLISLRGTLLLDNT